MPLIERLDVNIFHCFYKYYCDDMLMKILIQGLFEVVTVLFAAARSVSGGIQVNDEETEIREVFYVINVLIMFGVIFFLFLVSS